ncbi:hypothetical protein M747DRAFT_29018 [Aspergillus niger ATCC 13496]|uniref:Uncharacterized protein n=1 Tax=Aspergillus niger ATCC 13496 TaxID=1353008 RepID=A0A370BZ79_ASPNG|nr:hypothetical protein M747DRAFT_29018 [Aspergillus niger ATCC 13496]
MNTSHVATSVIFRILSSWANTSIIFSSMGYVAMTANVGLKESLTSTTNDRWNMANRTVSFHINESQRLVEGDGGSDRSFFFSCNGVD